jgi:hypothetical protein
MMTEASLERCGNPRDHTSRSERLTPTERERADVQAMIDARADRQDWRSGDDLAAAALLSLETRRSALEAIVSSR